MKAKNYICVDALDGTDMLGFYTRMFPAAIPIVYEHVEKESPLLKRIKDIYADVLFLIYSPMGVLEPNERNADKPFHLILLKNVYWFDKYTNMFFDSGNAFRGHNTRRIKVKCFGSVNLLMSAEDKKDLFRNYKDAIALAFKDGNPFKTDETAMTYVYNGKNLVETKQFFRWNIWQDKNEERIDDGQ